MAETVKGLNIVIAADKTKFNAALSEINHDLKNTNKELQALKRSLKIEWDATKFARAQELAQKRLEETRQKVELLQARLKYLNEQESTAGVRKDVGKLTSELSYAQLAAQKAKQQIKELDSIRLNALAAQLNTVGIGLKSAGQSMLPATVAIGAGFAASSKAAIDFESALASVKKTTDLSGTALDQMGDDLRSMSKDIPVTVKDLAELAASGGQLGIAKENLLKFTRTMADLGVATNLVGEEGAQTMARFANITQMPHQNFDRLGSTIVALGNNLATTESEIASMALRLAGAGKQAGLSEAEILSMAGALSSLGIEAEMGGSAFSKIMINMQAAVETGSAKLSEYANVAGISASDFAKAFKEDAASAVIAFIEGLRKAQVQGKSTIAMLAEMEITEVRMRDALLRAAGAGDSFRSAIELGSKAWAENTALTKEAAARYETTSSKIQIAKNELNDMAITAGETLLPIIQKLGDKVEDLSEWFNGLSDSEREALLATLAIVAVIGPLLIGIGQITIAIGGITRAINAMKVALATNPATVIIGIAAAVATLAISYAALTRGLSETQKANDAVNKALKESAQSAKAFSQSITDSAIESEAENRQLVKLIPQIEKLNEKKSKSAEEQAKLNRLVDAANNIIPGLITAVEGESGAWNVNTTAIRENMKARSESARFQAIQERQIELQKNRLKLELARDDAGTNLDIARKDYNAAIAEGREAKIGLYNDKIHSLQKNVADANAEIAKIDAEMVKWDAQIAVVGTTAEMATEKVVAAAVQTARSMSDVAKSYSDAKSEIGKLTNLQKKLNDEGKVTPELFSEIVSSYGDLAAAGLDYGQMLDGINAKIKEQSAAAVKANMDMAAGNKETLKASIANMLNSNQGLVATLSSLYGKDAVNWGLLASGKFTTESKLVQSLAELWAKYYGTTVQALQNERRIAMASGDTALANEISAFLSSKAALQAQFAELAKGLGGSYKGGGGGSSEDPMIKTFREAVKTLDYLRDMDTLDAKTYYVALADLQSKYLKEGSEEWRTVSKQLYAYKKQMYEDELKLAESNYKKQVEAENAAYNRAKHAAEASYKARIKAIEDAQAAEEQRINALIAGIDREIEAHNRLKESASYEKTVASLEAQIAFARDDESRIELERELARVKAEEAERLWLQQKEHERDLLQEQLNTVNALAESQKEAAQAAHEQTLAHLQTQHEMRLAQIATAYEAEQARIKELFEAAKAAAIETGKALGDSTSAAMVAGVNKMGETALQWIARIKAQAEASAAAAIAAAEASIKKATASIVPTASTTNNTNVVHAKATINTGGSISSGQVQSAFNNMINAMSRMA